MASLICPESLRGYHFDGEVRQRPEISMGPPHFLCHVAVCIHVQQHSARVAQQAVSPIGDDQRAHDTHQGIDPEPAEAARQEQPPITSTETAAPAMTRTNAARMLLSRCALAWAPP